VKEQFATPRRTEIEERSSSTDIEDLIQREDMVVTVTHGGYIKRVPLSTYRAQRRGGKGRAGMATRDEDFVSQPVRGQHAHADAVLLLAGHGLQAEGLAPAAGQSRRRAARRWSTSCRWKKARPSRPCCRCPRTRRPGQALHVMFATSTGNVRRNELSDFVDVKANGKIAMKLEEDAASA
jgi:DNA gyrase subunit A